MFNINYTKNDNSLLNKTLREKTLIINIQNYIPLYNKFFTFSEHNFNNFNLNQHFSITQIYDKIDNNIFKCNVIDSSQNKSMVSSFFKFSPLLDPIKYMSGKFDISENINILPQYLKPGDDTYVNNKLYDYNNSAYVDGFFSYLSSQLLHNYGFIHGIDFYGSFLGNKQDYKYNIIDDINYLHDSDFFYKNNDVLFNIEDIKGLKLINNHTRNYKRKINIQKIVNLGEIATDLDDDLFDNLFYKTNESELTIQNLKKYNLDNNIIYENNDYLTKMSQSSCCSSRTSDTSLDAKRDTDESNGDDENSVNDSDDDGDSDDESDGDSDGDGDGDSDSDDCDSMYNDSESSLALSDTEITANINNFPVQLISLELLDCTLEKLIELEDDKTVTIYKDNKPNQVNAMNSAETKSCLFQVIMILTTYQKVFDFTHNDLHTNNIMFNLTDKQFIYYKYANVHYKVPTYGKIYKIIDFGRSIYKYGKNVFCSDSYKNKEDAAGQYNFGPYYNNNKPELKPNKSFDLCRLGTCLFDFFALDPEADEDDDLTEDDKNIMSLINDWCTDTKGRNIAYKKNGEERYSDFKLYKMISRTVNGKEPEIQMKSELFKKYILSYKKL